MYSESGRLHVIGVLTCAGLIVMTFTLSSCNACRRSSNLGLYNTLIEFV